MKVTRRSLIAGTGAAMGAMVISPKPSWAPPPPPPPKKGIYGVYFNGASRGEVPASNLDFPASGQYLFGSVRFRSNVPKNVNYTIADLGSPTNAGSIVTLAFLGGTQNGKAGVYIGAANGTGQAVAVKSPSNSIPSSGWHLLKFGINTAAGAIIADLDDGPIPGLAYVPGSTGGFSMPYQVLGSLPLFWDAGRTVLSGPTWYKGDIEDLFICATTAFVSPTSQAVRDAFTDQQTGIPIYLPNDGEGVLPSDDPQILLHGPKSYFWQNLAKTSYTPFDGQSAPGAFTPYGAAITPSADDPWGFVGV